MASQTDDASARPQLSSGSWRLDPARSRVEFHVRHFYGLITVKGHFDSYAGSLDLARQPALELTIDGDSLDTKNRKRDTHLRSADFFDVENHPQVRYVSDSATLEGETLRVRGRLNAAGKEIPLDLDVRIRPSGDGFEVEAEAPVDHRRLGMNWSPLGILRAPSTLLVEGVLVAESPA